MDWPLYMLVLTAQFTRMQPTYFVCIRDLIYLIIMSSDLFHVILGLLRMHKLEL